MKLIEIMENLGMYLTLAGAPAEARKLVLEGLTLAYRLGVDEGQEGLIWLQTYAKRTSTKPTPQQRPRPSQASPDNQ